MTEQTHLLGMSDGILVDPNIWVPLVSAGLSVIVTLIIVFVVEPWKWRSRYQTRAVEKSLEVHGWLLSVLRACQEKAKRQDGETDMAPHLLESSDIWTLEEIFGKRAYLLSDRLRQTWYDLQRKDKYFGMAGVKHRRTTKFPSLPKEFGVAPPLEITEEIIGSDLTEMQKQAETDFAELRSRYTKMVGFKPLE